MVCQSYLLSILDEKVALLYVDRRPSGVSWRCFPGTDWAAETLASTNQPDDHSEKHFAGPSCIRARAVHARMGFFATKNGGVLRKLHSITTSPQFSLFLFDLGLSFVVLLRVSNFDDAKQK